MRTCYSSSSSPRSLAPLRRSGSLTLAHHLDLVEKNIHPIRDRRARPEYPAAQRIRPQLASSPKKAVFTRGDSAMARATFSASGVRALSTRLPQACGPFAVRAIVFLASGNRISCRRAENFLYPAVAGRIRLISGLPLARSGGYHWYSCRRPR